MATNLLTPKSAVPSGLPPKNILVFVGLGILVAIGVASIFMGDSNMKPVDTKAEKATLQEATATTELGLRGNPKEVTNAADEAGIPATFRGVGPLPAASASKSSDAQVGSDTKSAAQQDKSMPSPYPLPAGGSTASQVGGKASQAEIDAVRDTEISNAKAVVFDFGAASATDASLDKSPVDPIAALIAEQRADASRSQAARNAFNPSQFMGANAGDGQPKTSSARDADKVFLKEVSNTRKEPGIRPSPPEAALMLAQGSSIEAVLLRSITTDLPGVITARTTRDIYDSQTVTRIVIPKGSTVIGEYSSEVRAGQSRLLFAFSRLVLPDGQSFDLAGFTGSDPQGRSGLGADVDNHYFRLFGTSLLIGLIADRSVRRDAVPSTGVGGGGGGLSATGQILVETVRGILQKNREVAPTLTIESGARVNIEVRRDMIFPVLNKG
jgi:type IV secretion system protein VirB10